MSNFYIQYAISATPIEELIAADTTTKTRLVHSDIDKSMGGSREIAIGTDKTYTKFKSIATGTSVVLLSDGDIFGGSLGASVEFIMIVIKSAASTGIPNCRVEISNGSAWVEVCKLKKVNDSMLLPLTAKNLSEVRISSSASTTLANVEILVGKD